MIRWDASYLVTELDWTIGQPSGPIDPFADTDREIRGTRTPR
jgi:hypothetical protein